MKFISLGAAFLTVTAVAQQGGKPEFKPKETKQVAASNAPVTRAEAAKTFDKAWKALVRGLKIQGTAPHKFVVDSKPVSKDEVLSAVLAITNAAKPKFKRIPVSLKYDPKKLRADMDQKKFLPLIKLGFVMPYGPLVTGKPTNLSTAEFGDAVGVMLIRIADLSHLPSRQFSPALMDGG